MQASENRLPGARNYIDICASLQDAHHIRTSAQQQRYTIFIIIPWPNLYICVVTACSCLDFPTVICITMHEGWYRSAFIRLIHSKRLDIEWQVTSSYDALLHLRNVMEVNKYSLIVIVLSCCPFFQTQCLWMQRIFNMNGRTNTFFRFKKKHLWDGAKT